MTRRVTRGRLLVNSVCLCHAPISKLLPALRAFLKQLPHVTGRLDSKKSTRNARAIPMFRTTASAVVKLLALQQWRVLEAKTQLKLKRISSVFSSLSFDSWNQKALDPDFEPTPTTDYVTQRMLMKPALSIRKAKPQTTGNAAQRMSMNRGFSMQGSSMQNELTDPVTLTFDL